MLRRDHTLKETQRLAQLIAKLLRLKNEQPLDAVKLYNDILLNEFSLTDKELHHLTNDEFGTLLHSKNYNADQLITFAQLLYHHITPFKNDKIAVTLANKALITFKKLELQHHIQSFDNLSMINHLHQYLKEHHV